MASFDSNCTRLVVAAFDFGTTFSGYAFSFRDKPLDIKYNPKWVAGSEKLMSLKTPTCVLLKPNKEFHSFGFEAENKFADLAEDDEHHEWYMFRRFKMLLYEAKDLHLDTLLEDISGKKMPALTVFGHAIRFLNNHLLKTLCTQTVGITSEDIQYVITVPAIWNQKAKQFMRKAAVQGGIKDNQLRIALEPEAASIWCQVDTDHKLSGLAGPGSKYMVVDLGGGTADITVHEKLANGTLKEIHKASGGSWGGVEVDKAYLQMLTNVVGQTAMENLRRENTADYYDILRDFETKKMTITIDTDGKMAFKIPAALKEFAENSMSSTMSILVENSPYQGKMIWAGDKIRIEKTLAKSLFDKPIGQLTKHVKSLLSEPHIEDIDAILLVGGFGECELVKVAFETFVRCKLLVPADAGLAVLKGAVRFGHLPKVVSSRTSQYTFGRDAAPDFDEKIHSFLKRDVIGGKVICSDVFSALVTIGENVPVGKEICQDGVPVYAEQPTGRIGIYSSTSPNPQYVTDESCTLLGEIPFNFPESNCIDDKKVKIYFTFGDTELRARVVVVKTNATYDTTIECL